MPSILVRSERAQNEPYKPLNDALKMNTAGWHLHLISEDGRKGGHVLELAVQDGTLELDIISKVVMVVPNSESFNGKSLATDLKKEIEQVEGK